MSKGETNGAPAGGDRGLEDSRADDKRRLMLTQILKSPVLNPAGDEVGRVEDLIVKLGEGGGAYPPVTGIKVRIGGSDVYVPLSNIDKLAPGEVSLSSPTVHTGAFQRRPGEVLLAADVLGRHLMDVARGRIVQAHDLVLGRSTESWVLLGLDRSPRAMLRRLIPRRARPDLRRHAILDWKDVQPFVGHVPTAKLLMPLQRLRRLHPAQIADLVESASHEEGEEILDAVESDAELTADVFEEMDTEHQVEFLKSRSNEEAAKVLGRMAPDDAADLLAELDHDRLAPMLSMLPAPQQNKLRKLLQYHPTTAGGMMNPDFISVLRGTSAAEAIERVRTDDKAPHQLLSTVFVTETDGKFIGSLSLVDLLRSDPTTKVEDQPGIGDLRVSAGADLADVSLMMADYNLTALAVTDTTSVLVGAISVDDVLEALVPENWRNRIEASSGV
ncbi:MAG TPA: CBS domain-containing protein [Candidatus Dormibacteraeota bacterium]|jgi:CBS domain-containing protein/sporulation protein YlmC with PRC-barrel domain